MSQNLACKNMGLLAHLSTKCSWWATVMGQCPLSIIRHTTSTICIKWLLHPWANFTQTSQEYCLGDFIKKAKMVLLQWTKWPPELKIEKSVWNFFSWTKRPIVLKLLRKYLDDHWTYPGYFETQILIKPVLGGVCSLANYSVAYEEISQTKSPIFEILFGLCFQRQYFILTFFSLFCSWCCAMWRP